MADRDRGEDASEDWLHDVDPAPARWLESLNRGAVVLAVLAVGFLIAVLAAAGVFSSNPPRSAPAVTSVPATTSITQPTATASRAQAQAPSAPTTNLKPGDAGAQVKMLQRALASVGFSVGKIDGRYGPATISAVKQFQRSVKLTDDGIAGRATRVALATALHPG